MPIPVYWADHNRWHDRCVYVTLDELCSVLVPGQDSQIIDDLSRWYHEYDCYLLPGVGPNSWVSTGVRHGPNDVDYLSPLADREKARAFLEQKGLRYD